MKNLSRLRKIPSFQLDRRIRKKISRQQYSPYIGSRRVIRWRENGHPGLVRSLSYTRLQERRGGGKRYCEFFNPGLRSKLKLNGASDRPPSRRCSQDFPFAAYVSGNCETAWRSWRGGPRDGLYEIVAFRSGRRANLPFESRRIRTSVCSKTFSPKRFFFENIKFRLNSSSKISNQVTWGNWNNIYNAW